MFVAIFQTHSQKCIDLISESAFMSFKLPMRIICRKAYLFSIKLTHNLLVQCSIDEIQKNIENIKYVHVLRRDFFLWR